MAVERVGGLGLIAGGTLLLAGSMAALASVDPAVSGSTPLTAAVMFGAGLFVVLPGIMRLLCTSCNVFSHYPTVCSSCFSEGVLRVETEADRGLAVANYS